MAVETSTEKSEAGRLAGILAPVLTPFGQDLAPDARRLARHCRWLLAHGCAALAPFGTTSEANSLSVDEREALLDALVSDGVPAVRLMPGTGCCALPDSVRLTSHAVRRGCAGVLMLPPFYYKGVSDDGLFRGFAEVIERVGDIRLRVYLYHIPPVAQVAIGPRLVERLLRAYPNVFVGSERFLLENLRGGGVGCITATGNVNAAAIERLFASWRSPDADRLQEEVNAIRSVVEKLPVIPALKVIVADHASDPAWVTVRPPLVALAPEKREPLLAELRARGFSMPGLREA